MTLLPFPELVAGPKPLCLSHPLPSSHSGSVPMPLWAWGKCRQVEINSLELGWTGGADPIRSGGQALLRQPLCYRHSENKIHLLKMGPEDPLPLPYEPVPWDVAGLLCLWGLSEIPKALSDALSSCCLKNQSASSVSTSSASSYTDSSVVPTKGNHCLCLFW